MTARLPDLGGRLGSPLCLAELKSSPYNRRAGTWKLISLAWRWDGQGHSASLAGRAKRWLTYGALFVMLASACAGQQNNDRFEKYLSRLGLTELQAVHLEQLLEQQTGGQRIATAQRLADVYAAQLVGEAEDADRSKAIMQHIERLIERIPQAKTASLDVMLLMADYYRAEKQITSWMADESNPEPKSEALEILRGLVPSLTKRQTELSAQVQQLIQQTEELDEGKELDLAERELAQIQTVAGRAIYFAATSQYYLALLGGPEESTGFAAARDLFRKLLGLVGSYQDFDVSMLGLDSPWRCRALIGLALAEAAMGNRAGSQQCFLWLEDDSVPSAIRDQAPYWRLWAMKGSGAWGELLQFARQQVSGYSQDATPGRVSFCVALVRTGLGASKKSAESREIGMLGLAGLIKIGEVGIAGRLLDEFKITVGTDAGFYLKWMKGQQLFSEAVSTKANSAYSNAAKMFTEALQLRNSVNDVRAVAQCRSQLASCLYALGEKEQAARLFEQAFDGLRTSRDRGAAQAAWNAFLCYQALAKEEPRFVASGITVLNQIKRDLPGSSYAKLADYHIGKLRQGNLSSEELIAQWEKVLPNSRSYLAARFDICRVWYKLWRQRTGKEKSEAAAQLVSNVSIFMRAAGRDQAARKARACLLVVAVAMGSDPPDPEMARGYLTRAKPFIAGAGPVATEFHYRGLQLGGVGKTTAINEHEAWIAHHPDGSDFERAALGLVVKAREAAYRELAPNERKKQHEILYDRLRRLAELLSDKPDQARIARSKMARYASALGKHEKAAETLEGLLRLPGHENNKAYLQRAARAHFNAGDYGAALPRWRTLLRGLRSGSEDWYEAKFHQLACLRRLDNDGFRQAAQQFRVLYQDSEPPAWRTRFRELLGSAEE